MSLKPSKAETQRSPSAELEAIELLTEVVQALPDTDTLLNKLMDVAVGAWII